VEPTSSQLIALFEAWRRDIDSEPFAYEHEWATPDSLRFRVVPLWGRRITQPGVID
jgi:hypothetical protein